MKPSPSACGTISTRLELLTGTVIMVKVMELSCSIVLHSLASIGGVLLLVVFSRNGGRRLKTTRFLLRIWSSSSMTLDFGSSHGNFYDISEPRAKEVELKACQNISTPLGGRLGSWSR